MEATMLAVPKRTLPALIAIVALSAPATASARPNLDPVTMTSGEAQSAAAFSSPSGEFQWGDAGIGAVGALALLGGTGAGSLALRRRRRHA